MYFKKSVFNLNEEIKTVIVTFTYISKSTLIDTNFVSF